jgi:hypothetical protein
MGDILTIEEVKNALSLDYDADNTEMDRLSKTASSFVYEHTGYDFGSETEIHPIAKQVAIMHVRMLYFQNGNTYNREHDYSYGMTSMLHDLIAIAARKLEEAA